ncbi:MAG: hypothetical protein H6729_16620 [Deltaproteobacteria bacterium]|nr:hypothetical protein [Deltaproteobacteria bacterium]
MAFRVEAATFLALAASFGLASEKTAFAHDGAMPLSPLGIAVATTPASAATARLEDAMEKVRQAIAALDRDAPGPKEFDRANAALTELSTLTDAGSDLEPKDLDYAKTALKARRMLREKRTYLDDKRAKADVFTLWRELKQTLTDLQDSVERATRKEGTNGSRNGTKGESEREAEAKLAKLKARLAEDKTRQGGQVDDAFGVFVRDANSKVDELIHTLAQRRTALEIERARVQIETQTTKLNDAVRGMHESKPTDDAFERADAALRTLEETIANAKSLATKDAAFARTVETAKEDIKRCQKDISATFSAVGLARLKEELEPAHRALQQLARELAGKSSHPTNDVKASQAGDDRIAEGRTASIIVRKLLDKFQGLIARSEAVRGYANDVRKTLIEVETQLQERALAPFDAALDHAASALAVRAPSEDSIAEAEGLLDALRPVLAQGEPLERESRAYAQSARQSRKKSEAIARKLTDARVNALVAAKTEAIDKARRDLLSAINALKRRSPSDDQFKEAKTAQIVLEKTLEQLDDDKTLASAVRRDKTTAILRRESEKIAKNAAREIDQRQREVEAERKRATVDPNLKFIERALEKARRQPSVDAATLDEIDAKIVEARAMLAAGEAIERQVFDYRKWAREARRILTINERDLSKQRYTLTLNLNRSSLDDELSAARDATAQALALEATEADIDRLSAHLQAVRKAFAHGVEIASNDRTHRAYLARVERAFAAIAPKLDLARTLLTLREKMSEASFGAESSLEKASSLAPGSEAGAGPGAGAGSASSLAEQKRLLDAAVSALETCQQIGTSTLDATPEVSDAMIAWRAPKTPTTLSTKAFVARCGERLETTKETLKKVTGLLAFERGPKRTSEAGRERLSRASSASGSAAKALYDEALDLFEECISSGKILEYSNPELKDRAFEVGGRSITLPALIKECTTESKRLRSAQR